MENSGSEREGSDFRCRENFFKRWASGRAFSVWPVDPNHRKGVCIKMDFLQG